MMRRIAIALVAASFPIAFACTAIDAPAERSAITSTEGDAEADAADEDADDAGTSSRCRANSPWLFASDAGGLVLAGDAPPSETALVAGTMQQPRDAGTERITYVLYLAGDPSLFPGAGIVDLGSPTNIDLSTCAYCALAYTNCPTGGLELTCDAEYRAVSGRARVVRLPNGPGAYWADIDHVELAKVASRDGLSVKELDRDDCMTVDRVTFIGALSQGKRPCAISASLFCAIADSASRRSPVH